MRLLVAALAAFFLQVDSIVVPRGRAAIATPCVPTEHMPVLGRHPRQHDPMSVLQPDSTFRSRMPVLMLQACYLVDSLRRQR